ncbi:FeoA family protein [Streptomyces fractus]|uniref:FeoA family protein n=1 Tax=Streptomyces fractus TaxID=641806 RepID=UPI003CF66D7E
MDDTPFPPGSRHRLVTVRAAADHRRRLIELGFVPGAVLRVVCAGGAGGRLLAVGESRVAVDAELLAMLRTELLGAASGLVR